METRYKVYREIIFNTGKDKDVLRDMLDSGVLREFDLMTIEQAIKNRAFNRILQYLIATNYLKKEKGIEYRDAYAEAVADIYDTLLFIVSQNMLKNSKK